MEEEQTTCSWITPQAVSTSLEDGGKESIIDGLIALLERTGHVAHASIVKQDIMHREELGSTGISELVFIPHAHTAGVKTFCASLAVVGHKAIYMLIAWDEHIPAYLKRMASIIEILLDKDTQSALLAAKDGGEAYACLHRQLVAHRITG